jgi:hypothetical protein
MSLPSSPTDKLPSTGRRVVYSPAKRSARDFVDLCTDDDEEDTFFSSITLTLYSFLPSLLDFAIDPLGFIKNKTPEQVKVMKEKELMNGRLAMWAIGGIATQSVLTGHGFPYI